MTDNNTHKTALVTGATSGLGFEAAAQLAESGYASVTITGRSEQKAEEARSGLAARTGRDVFQTLALDLNEPKSVAKAAEELVQRGHKIDFLLLNAGMVSGSDLVRTDEGLEITSASSLVGHHQLTMQMLENDLLGDNARIVIASSEVARGDVPTFNPVELPEFAAKHYDGDMAAAAEALLRYDAPIKYSPATAYANAKLFVAYWSAELARRLPSGMTVNAVSPGSAPDTNADRNATFFMKNVLVRFFKLMPGMSAPVSVAAGRFLEAAEYPEQVTGEFFASAPKKMTGELHEVDLPHVNDRSSQDALWDALVRVSGGVIYPISA
jgi:NAD(P)-dependent dehydrogenase (short-subunit alcohol dehydrogenase family)